MYLTFFNWAEFKNTKANLTIPTSIDDATKVPDCIIFSNDKCYDSNKMDNLTTDKRDIYICDKNYIDYDKSTIYI